jgi:hypothetical protein
MLIAVARAVAMVSLALALQAEQATAQNLRSFVSGHGTDSNPCSLAAPCRSLQVAHDATNPKGEIVVLDSAGYGSLTITKAISIVNPGGVEAGITPNNGPAISVQAGPNDVVALRGLTLEGEGSPNRGIRIQSGLRFEVIDCVIRDFSVGIEIAFPPNYYSIYVKNTILSGNSIFGFASNGDGIVTMDRVSSIHNGGVGVGFGGTSEVLIADSHIDNNGNGGVQVDNSNVILRNTTINQTPGGIILMGTANVWLSQVTEPAVGAAAASGIVFQGGGPQHVYSDATNRLAGVMGGTLESWLVQ